MTTKQEVKHNIMRRIMELRTKDMIEEDCILDVLDDYFDPYINDLCEENKRLLGSCEGATMMYKDLCKAKEIINELVDDYITIGYASVDSKLIDKATDFIKEVKT